MSRRETVRKNRRSHGTNVQCRQDIYKDIIVLNWKESTRDVKKVLSAETPRFGLH